MTLERMTTLLDRIYDGNEEIVEEEYIGTFVVNGKFTLRKPEDGLKRDWENSVVPIEYFPLYGLKCDDPVMAGGLFDEAPFEAHDADDLRYRATNLPTEPEPLFELCADSSGAPFWVGESTTVYGHNLDNEIQPIGNLSDFVEFAIEMSLQETKWHKRLNDSRVVSEFNLTPISMMG